MGFETTGRGFDVNGRAFSVAGTQPTTVTEDFEDDAVGIVPEGWALRGTAGVDMQAYTTTGTVLNGSQSVRLVEEGGGATELRNPANIANASVTLQSTVTTVQQSSAFAGFQFFDDSGNLLRVAVNPDTGDLVYRNNQAGIDTTRAVGYTAGDTITLEIRNATTGIEVLIDGTVEYNGSDTFTNVAEILVVSEDTDTIFDDVTYETDETNPFSEPSYVELTNLSNWWPFRAGDGGRAYVKNYVDIAASQNFATTGTAWSVDAKVGGYSQLFDGTDDEINLGAYSEINDLPTGDFTICAWVKTETTTGADWDTALGTWDGGSNSSPVNLRLFTDSNNETNIDFRADHGSQQAQTQTVHVTSTVQQTWAHIAAVWDSSTKTASIYINGAEASYATQTAGSGSYVGDSTLDKHIGQLGFDGQWFNGRLDDIRIYTSVLTQTQIQAIYDATK